MFCRNCGQKLADGDKFCSSCGTKTEVAENITAPVEAVGQAAPAEEKPLFEPFDSYPKKWFNAENLPL